MNLSAEETAIVADFDKQIIPEQLQTMLDICNLRGILTLRQEEEVESFAQLIRMLLELDRIRHGNLGLVRDLLENAGRDDLAQRVPNGVAPERLPEDDTETVYVNLKRRLQDSYKKFFNMNHISANTPPCAVDAIFCDVQLFINKLGTKDSLRQPLGSYKDLVRRKEGNYSRVLLKGKSASGKTTVLRKLTKDWVDGLLPEFDILIVLSMGSLKRESTVGEAVVRCLLPQDCNITATQVDSIVHRMRDRIGILFDNYGDYKAAGDENGAGSSGDAPSTRRTTFVMDDILTYRKLQDLFVLVAAKAHGSTMGEIGTEYQHVELHGFAEENIDKYIPKFVLDVERRQSLIKYLETNDLRTLARTPAFLQLLCQYWNTCKQLQNPPPEMLTLLFHNMIWGLYSHMNDRRSGTAGAAPPDVNQFKAMMLTLGKKAFQLLLKRLQVFSLDKLKQGNNTEEKRLINLSLSLGLLKYEDPVSSIFICPNHISDDENSGFDESDSEEDENTDGLKCPLSPMFDKSVSFHSDHIFWYCAAVYLRDLARTNFPSFEKKLKRLMKTYPRVLKMRFLFLFSFGGDSHRPSLGDRQLNIKIGRHMLKRLNALMKEDIENLRQSRNEKTEMLLFERMNQFRKLCLQCNYEAQVKSALNQQMTECLEGGHLTLVGISEYTTRALQYFLRHSQPQMSPSENGVTAKFQLRSMKIIFLGSDVSMTYKKEFAKHIPGEMNFFRSLMRKYIVMSPEELREVHELMANGFGEVQFARDLCAVKKVALLSFYQHIRRWHPHTNVLRPTLGAVMKFQSSNLRELSLMVPDVKEEVWSDLFGAFQNGQFKALVKFDIGFCKLDHRQLRTLAECFMKLSNLKVLVLSGNRLTRDLVESIGKLQQLTELGLQDCELDGGDLAALLLSLHDLRKLEKLDLRRNNFSEEHTFEFENLLGHLELKSLKLSLTSVDQNIKHLIDSLSRQKKLQVLHLNHCPKPWELLGFSKDIPSDLPDLVDLRLSGSLPRFEDGGAVPTDLVPHQLPKIKLSPLTLAAFSGNLMKSHKLETFSLLYCELDHSNFVDLYRACKYMQTNHRLNLMRYSCIALPRPPRPVRLARILSDEKGEDFLQLW